MMDSRLEITQALDAELSNFTRLPDISGIDEQHSPSPDVALARSGHKTVKDYERHLKALENANFELKLRVHMLEERLQQQDSPERAQEMVVNLKVQLGELREDMAKKRALLLAARDAIDSLERQCGSESAQLQQRNQQLVEENRQLLAENKQLLEENQLVLQDNHQLVQNCQQMSTKTESVAVSGQTDSSPALLPPASRRSSSDDLVQQLRQQASAAEKQANQLLQQGEKYRAEMEAQRISNDNLKSQLCETVAMLKQTGEELAERTASLVEARGREGRLVRQLKEQHASRCRLSQWLQHNLSSEQLKQVPVHAVSTEPGQVNHVEGLKVRAEHQEVVSGALLSPPLSADCDSDLLSAGTHAQDNAPPLMSPAQTHKPEDSCLPHPPSGVQVEVDGCKSPPKERREVGLTSSAERGGEDAGGLSLPGETAGDEEYQPPHVPSGEVALSEKKPIKQCFSPVVISTAACTRSNSVLNPLVGETDVTVLRRCLAESRRSCQLLRRRLSELSDFLERLLRLEEDGLLDLSSVLSIGDRSELQQSLMQCRDDSLVPHADQLADLSTAALAAAELSRRASLLPREEALSESESWSEPDRSVSLARMGLACADVSNSHHHQHQGQQDSTTANSEYARSKYSRRRRTVEYRNESQMNRRRYRRHCSDAGIQTDMKFGVASCRSSSLGRRDDSVKPNSVSLQQAPVNEGAVCLAQSEASSPEARHAQEVDVPAGTLLGSFSSESQLLPLRRQQFRQLAEQCQLSSRRRLQHATSVCQPRQSLPTSPAESDQLNQLRDKYQELEKQLERCRLELETSETSRQEVQRLNEQLSNQLIQLHATNETLSAETKTLRVQVDQSLQQQEQQRRHLQEEFVTKHNQLLADRDQLQSQIDRLSQEKDQLMKQMDQLNKEKQQVMNQMSQEKQQLEEQMNQEKQQLINQSDRTNQEKHQLTNQLKQRREEFEEQMVNVKKEKQQLMKQIDQLNRGREELMNQMDWEKQQLMNQLDREKQQLMNQLNQERQHLTNQIDQLNQQKEQLMNQMVQLNQEKEQLMNRLKQDRQQLMNQLNQEKQQLMNQLDQMNQDKQQLMNQMDRMNQDKQQLSNQMDQMNQEKQQLLNQLDQMNQENKQLLGRVDEMQNRLNQLGNNCDKEVKQVMDQMNQQKQQMLDQLDQINHEKEQLTSRVNELNQHKMKAQQRNVQLMNEVKELNQDKQTVIADLNKVQLSTSAELERLRNDVQSLTSENVELRHRLKSLKSDRKSANTIAPAISAEDSDGMSSHTSADLGIESDMVKRLAVVPSTSRPSKGRDVALRESEAERQLAATLSELAETRHALKQALDRQNRADQRKVRVEKAICRQLTKTHDILQRAKSNLSSEDPSASRKEGREQSRTQDAHRKLKNANSSSNGDKENLLE